MGGSPYAAPSPDSTWDRERSNSRLKTLPNTRALTAFLFTHASRKLGVRREQVPVWRIILPPRCMDPVQRVQMHNPRAHGTHKQIKAPGCQALCTATDTLCSQHFWASSYPSLLALLLGMCALTLTTPVKLSATC